MTDLLARRAGDGTFAPDELTIDHLHRHGGTRTPGDEEPSVALRSGDGTEKGTLSLAYGAYAGADEADVARAPRDGRGPARPPTPWG